MNRINVNKNSSITSIQKGFSLLEALIALVLLAFVMLGLSSLTLSTIETNRQARRITAATNLALDKLEVIRQLDYALVVSGTDGPLTESGATSGTGAIYTRTWIVTDHPLVTNTKVVTLTCVWTDEEGTHSVPLTTIVSL